MSDDSPRSNDSAPSLSSYPPAFVSLINTFIKRAEDAETRAHKALVILKDKDGQVAELQQRMESLENVASRLDENSVPPLDLPRSSSSSYIGHGSPHPRELDAQESRTQPDDPPLETLYERKRTPPTPEARAEDPTDCYARCQQLLAEMQRSNCQLEKTAAARVVNENVLRKSEERLASPHLLNSDMNMDMLNLLSIGRSSNRSDMVVIDKADIKECVDMAGSIINSIQQRLEEEDHKLSERKIANLSRTSLCKKSSRRSSVSSYHTPKSNMSSRLLIRRRNTTHCFFPSLNRAHKKLRLKYHHVYEKFKESLTLCGKLQDDIVALTVHQNKKREVNVAMFDKYTQTQVATRGSTSLLQGRLDAASQVMRSRLAELQELRTQLDDSQSLVVSLKKKLSRAEAETAKNEAQLAEAAATNTTQSVELQHLKLRLSNILKAKQIIDDREETFSKELKDMKRSMEIKITALEALVEAVEEKDSISAQATKDLESKLKRLKEQLMLHIVDASERLTAADTKIHQLYLAIQTFLKMVFGLWKGSYCESINARGQSDVELQAMRVANEILQLPPDQLNSILQTSTNVNKWLRKCRKLVFEEDFAERLGCLLVEAVFEAKNS